MKSKTVHVISHSHWDREWYMPFEKFRMRLVRLIDQVLDLLAREDRHFHFFHLDGHVLLVDDYLQIRPHREEELKRAVRERKLFIGPWYVLQDAFLTSGEAQVRNLTYGIERANELGGYTKIGYFPDTFGNISQSAQLLQGFEIENAVFGRGINSIAENNTVLNESTENGYRSELWWEAPDGSRVLSVFLANWYHNGMEMPVESAAAKERATIAIHNTERFATSPHLLLMNGCDHQPVQSDIGESIRTLNAVMPEYEFRHSHFEAYFKELRGKGKEKGSEWQTVHGELTGERTDGWTTLVNTASSRLYLKQWNVTVQNELTHWAEPFSAIAWSLGRTYPDHFLRHAWQTLLQNHPHDSICGCSVDDVHEEMTVRFKKVQQVAETLTLEALDFLVEQVDTESFRSFVSPDKRNDPDALLPFVIFNPLSFSQSGWVSVQLLTEQELNPDEYLVIGADGKTVASNWTDDGWKHGFTLPDDAFRIPWHKRAYTLRLRAADIPSFGYSAFAWLRSNAVQNINAVAAVAEASLLLAELTDEGAVLENAYLRVEVHNDGTFDLLSKETGRMYRDLCELEDSGDIGNEYMFVAPAGDTPFTTRRAKAELRLSSGNGLAEVTVVHKWMLPLKREGRERSSDKKEQQIKTVITLGEESKRVDICISMDNGLKDHRLRALFPTDLQADTVHADAPFDVTERWIVPWEGWKNPAKCERMQSFVDMSDGMQGLMISAYGLPEYEALRDERHTIALTLLRSIGELGDWNVFLTPDAQCLGPHEARFSVIPHEGNYRSGWKQSQSFQLPLRGIPCTAHQGTLPLSYSWLEVEGEDILVTSLKKADRFDGLTLRFFNLDCTGRNVIIKREFAGWAEKELKMNEEQASETYIRREQNELHASVPSKKIITLGLRKVDLYGEHYI